ncbi:MAG: alpha/beta hydrolase [Spirochaetaceae bacterium]|nr:MAG: alpha/beta hydrolase [Spirochaetaceae bacterium]
MIQSSSLLSAAALGIVALSLSGCATRIPAREVDSLSHVRLGGLEQAVLARGESTGLPVLLWLHGGPGAAQMPLAHRYTTELEESFIVVHWDQRGAGKSNPRGFEDATMTVEQYVQDARELTRVLQTAYRQERIYLLGHSWGTKIGLLLARDYPQDYHAFISVGQVVDSHRAQEVAYAWLSSRIEAEGHARAHRKLARLGPAPYRDHGSFVEFMGMVDRYGGGMDVGFSRLFRDALTSPYYRGGDYLRWLNGARRGSGPMWDTYAEFSAIRDVPRVEVPIHFISGENDMNTPVNLVREYFEALDAPRGKRIHVMSDCAHAPFLGNPSEFNHVVREIALAHYGSNE